MYDQQTRRTVYLQAGDPTDRYFTNLTWSPDGSLIYLIELPRSQDSYQLVSYDARTGERLKVLYTESNPKYVHPTHALSFLPWDPSASSSKASATASTTSTSSTPTDRKCGSSPRDASS